MRRFTVPCDFSGTKSDFHLYVGNPSPNFHPLRFQQDWLRIYRRGEIPDTVLNSFDKLRMIAESEDVAFDNLCVYALNRAGEEDDGSKTSNSASLREKVNPSAVLPFKPGKRTASSVKPAESALILPLRGARTRDANHYDSYFAWQPENRRLLKSETEKLCKTLVPGDGAAQRQARALLASILLFNHDHLPDYYSVARAFSSLLAFTSPRIRVDHFSYNITVLLDIYGSSMQPAAMVSMMGFVGSSLENQQTVTNAAYDAILSWAHDAVINDKAFRHFSLSELHASILEALRSPKPRA